MRERYIGRVESPDAYIDESILHDHFCLVLVFFWTALPCSGGLTPGVGWNDVT